MDVQKIFCFFRVLQYFYKLMYYVDCSPNASETRAPDSPKSETSTCCYSDCSEAEKNFLLSMGSMNGNILKNQNIKLKNQLCKNFMREGRCPYNNKCQFAHGSQELRQKTDHNVFYKTKQCHSFFNTGICMYGERCNFMHRIENKNSVSKWSNIRKNYPMLLGEVVQRSRLFNITQQQN